MSLVKTSDAGRIARWREGWRVICDMADSVDVWLCPYSHQLIGWGVGRKKPPPFLDERCVFIGRYRRKFRFADFLPDAVEAYQEAKN
ncbi:MAG: hypothetical protein JNM52_09615 [Betaproteobacteria bacterium]|nr:hypothetical protein [Betaproteobacteria bacterium]